MAKCSFCNKQVEHGRGVIFVAMDRVYNFCSSKCIKNFKLGRKSSKVAWVRKSGKKKTRADLKAELLEEAKHEVEKPKEEKPEEEKKEEKKPAAKEEKKQVEKKAEEKKPEKSEK